MKIKDKRNDDKTLSEFKNLPAGTVFEVPDSSAILMKLNDNGVTVHYYPKDGEIVMDSINAIILRPDKRHGDDEWAIIEPWARVRALDAELIINGHKTYDSKVTYKNYYDQKPTTRK